jgi:hypothetical protein
MIDELPQLEKVRGRSEAPAKPPFFDQSLLLIGGKTPLGEPLYKVSWGWDLFCFRNGNPSALRYPGPFLNRWIWEKWMPPSFFGSKKQWEEHRWARTTDGKWLDSLGEFPRQGMYGMKMPLVTKDGGFIPLGSSVLEFIDMIHQHDLSQGYNVYSDAKLYARLQEQMAEEEARMLAEAEKEAEDHGDYVRAHEGEINASESAVQFFRPAASLWTPGGEVEIYHDKSGAKHTLWEDSRGDGHARIDFTMPTKEKGTT